jgi:hypothetical protein
MHLMEQTLGGTFTFEEGTDPYIRVGTVAVYVGGHDFDDDDIAWPGGSDVPLRSLYPAMIEFRDTGGDQQRQQAIAGQVFARPGVGGPIAGRLHRRHAEGSGPLSARLMTLANRQWAISHQMPNARPMIASRGPIRR